MKNIIKTDRDDSVVELIDNGNFLRGLLLLIRSDKTVWDHEQEIFLKLGKKLGYNEEYCLTSLQSLMKNEHIDCSPPLFFKKAIALKFLHTALDLIVQDEQIHNNKVDFLTKTAIVNSLGSFLHSRKTNKLLRNRLSGN